MNIVNLQGIKLIHRNPLPSYMLTMKKSETEIKETIPLTIAMKILKNLGKNLPKEIKGLYTENNKTQASFTTKYSAEVSFSPKK